jgi:calnexin
MRGTDQTECPPAQPAPPQVHVILKAHNPTTGATSEHHLAQPPQPPNDRLPHVYTLLLPGEGGDGR